MLVLQYLAIGESAAVVVAVDDYNYNDVFFQVVFQAKQCVL